MSVQLYFLILGTLSFVVYGALNGGTREPTMGKEAAPASLACFDHAPFKFSRKIENMHPRYTAEANTMAAQTRAG